MSESIAYIFFATGQAGLVLLVPVVVGIAYFFSCQGTPALRCYIAAHSIALIGAFVYALAISPWSKNNWGMFMLGFWTLLLIFGIGVCYAIIRFKGNRAVHFLQLLQLPSAWVIWFVGSMTIGHEWI